MRDPSTLSDQISCQPLAPSLDIHHQRGKQLAGYSQHTVRQDHRQPYQEQAFEIPQQELRHGHTAPVGSHINSSSPMECPKMSGGEVRMVSTNDTQSLYLLRVQSLIEGCLQRYMNKKEVVEDLLRREKIEPRHTQIVLQKLEEQNEEFFKAYHLRLMVKQQIMIFNKLLEKQVELMRKMCPGGLSSLPISNGSHSLQLKQNPYNDAAEHAAFPSRPGHINHPAGPSNVLINNGSAMPPKFLADASPHSGRTDIAPNMSLLRHLHSGMLQGSFGVASKPGFSGYSNAAAVAAAFNADANVLGPPSTISGDVPVASLSGTESNLQSVHESFLDPEIGFLGQIPLNFSFSDLPAEFASDAIGNYNQPAFQETQIGNLQDSREEEGQENKLLHTAFLQGLSYDDLIND